MTLVTEPNWRDTWTLSLVQVVRRHAVLVLGLLAAVFAVWAVVLDAAAKATNSEGGHRDESPAGVLLILAILCVASAVALGVRRRRAREAESPGSTSTASSTTS